MVNRIQLIIIATAAFLMPILAIFAPLAIAAIFAIVIILPTYLFLKNGAWKTIWSDSHVNKVIIIFLIYSLASSLWAINPSGTINLWIRMVLFFIGAIALFNYLPNINNKEKILKFLLVGLILAIIIANIEIYTNGWITRHIWFYTDIYFSKNHQIRPVKNDYVVELNRGASVMSLVSWALIYWLCYEKKYKTAILLFLTVFSTIARLESLSTVVGFFAGGVVIFPLVYLKGKKALQVFAVLAVFGVASVATVTAMMDINKIIGTIPVVPGAASNMRLYIYDYAAKQAMKKPVFGWGFNSSRDYPVKKEEYVDGGRSPLPLHPHNNTLQIWLELGVTGLVIFSAFLVCLLLRIGNMALPPHAIAAISALFANYFIIGQTGYGMWQNWWVAGGILASSFLLLSVNSTKNG